MERNWKLKMIHLKFVWLLAIASLVGFIPDAKAQRFVKTVATIAELKALNSADIHSHVSVQGYSAEGDGGGGIFVWNSSDTSSTNWGTCFKGKTTGSELTTGRWNRVRNQVGAVDIAWFGVGNVAGDHPKFTNALALAGQVLLTKSITLNTNATINQTNAVRVTPGAVVKLGSGMVLSQRGLWDASTLKCFDISAGGKVTFESLASGIAGHVTSIIWADWWGPSHNNSTGADTSLLQAWLSSTPSGNATVKGLLQGSYTVDSALLVSNRFVIRGFGRPQINLRATASSASIFSVVAGSADVLIDGIVFAGVNSGNAFTNDFGIRVAPDVDRLKITYNSFTGFKGGGIYKDGGLFAEGDLYDEIAFNFFTSLDNSAGNGGSSLWPAFAIVATNTVIDLSIHDNHITGADAAMWIHGQADGTNQAGHVIIAKNTIEACGAHSGMVFTNAVTIRTRGPVSISDEYMERNLANFGIYVREAKSLTVRGKSFAADYAGTKYTGTLIAADDVGHTDISGAIFNNCLTNFVAQLNGGVMVMRDCWFDLGSASGTNEATQAEIAARVVGNVFIKGRANPSANKISAVDSTGHFEAFKTATAGNNTTISHSDTTITIGATAPSSGTGFARVTAGVMDGAAVELSNDVTTTGNGAVTIAANAITTAKIADGNVTLPKLANIATDSILGRATAATGIIEVLLALPWADSGDVTRAADSTTTVIANNAVTLGKMATMSTDSILGRATAGSGNPEVLTALPFAQTGDVTRPADSNVATIAADAVTTAKIADGNVTLPKLANMATDSIVGRATSATGVPEILTALPFASTGDVTRPADSNVSTIAAGAVTTTKIADANVTAAKLTGGSAGQVLWWDPITSAAIWVSQPLKEDWFVGGVAGAFAWNTGTSVGTGSGALDNMIAAFGSYKLVTGAGTTGSHTKRLGTDRIFLGTGTTRLLMALTTPSSLSDATDTYQIYVGYGKTDNAENTDGAYFTYTHSLSSGNWVGKTASNSSYTTASGGSSVAVTAASVWWLLIEANSTTANFYVAADSGGSTPGVPGAFTSIGSSTSNLPTSASSARGFGVCATIVKTAGTNSRQINWGRIVYIPSR